MFKIFDLNMNEITFPDGFMPLEIFVGSVAKNRYTQEVEGRSGIVDYGFDYTSRSVELFVRLKSKDHIDYRLLRNEVYELFDTGSMFYIAESHLPSRVLKVVVDDGYIPDRLTKEYADIDITCRTLDSVFWESTYTTMELHNTGYDAVVEKYGLVDNIDTDKINYRYEPTLKPNMIPLTQDDWEDGGYSTATGAEYNISARLRLKRDRAIAVVKGETYTIYDESLNTSAIDTINIFQYENGEYLGSSNWLQFNRRGEITIAAEGNEVLIVFNPSSGFNVPVSHINHPEERIKIKMEQGETFTGFVDETESFNIYNAGNVKIEPESMYLDIRVENLNTDGDFKIRNKTTGDEFILQRSSSGSDLSIKRMVVGLGGINNVFRDTNRRFISLASGDNEFEVSGGTYRYIEFDFKYYYK